MSDKLRQLAVHSPRLTTAFRDAVYDCSASKAAAGSGMPKKNFCTKLNFPSEPAHKVWLALTKERGPSNASSPQK